MELPQNIKHFFHPCPLMIIKTSSFTCNACYTLRRGTAYHCQDCDFYMDVECVQLPTLDRWERLHFCHRHPLTINYWQDTYYEEIYCKICRNLCWDDSYYCRKCSFYVHRGCIQNLLQEIRHFFHPCRLILLTTPSFLCGGCDREFPGLAFRCGKCSFHLCIKCSLLPTIESGDHEKIQHFLHRHPLTLNQTNVVDQKACCRACGKHSLGPMYGCKKCNFLLHKSCAELPREFPHFSHPSHPLTLAVDRHDRTFFTCNLCLKESALCHYCCSRCDFHLDIDCASLTPSIRQEDQHYSCIESECIQHFSHWHPLTLSEKRQKCGVCGNSRPGSIYGCNGCNFYLHKECMDMPREIQSFFHPCTLVLRTTKCNYCGACGKYGSGLTFCCNKCYFELDAECALQPIIKYEGRDGIKHISHGHPLTLNQEMDCPEVICKACEKSCLGSSSIYSCKDCDFYLHESCAELPGEIKNYLYHPSHPLVLLNTNAPSSENVRCSLCLKECHGFAFHCFSCNFTLDIECNTLKPTIRYQGHPHLLTVIVKLHEEIECRVCKESCINSPGFRCVECNFSLHLRCGPLPCTIKHGRHRDPLTLKDFYADDDDDDDNFYCDACENQRDPRHCVYYCAEGCPMICHISCVISEVHGCKHICTMNLHCESQFANQVIPSLRGERGDVQLRTVGKHIKCKVIAKHLMEQSETACNIIEENGDIEHIWSLDDIFDSLDVTEKREIDHIEAIFVQREIKNGRTSLEGKSKEIFAYSELAFAQFMDRFDSIIWNNDLPDYILEHNEFIIHGDYLVPQTLIPTFQDLLVRYKDVAAESLLTPKVASLIFFILCGVIQSMNTTKVLDVTEYKLREWLTYLKFVSHAGFKIDFIFYHLKRIARAHFGLQARKSVNDTFDEQEKKMEWISNEIEGLTMKLEATKAEREAIKKEKEDLETYVKSATTSLMKQFLNDATAMKWKPAAYGLL